MVVKFRKTVKNAKVYKNCISYPIINKCYSKSKMLGLIVVWDEIKTVEKIGKKKFMAYDVKIMESFCENNNILELKLDKFTLPNRGHKIISDVYNKYGLEDVRFMDEVYITYKYIEEYVEGNYKVSVRDKDGKKIFHLNTTDKEPDSLYVELLEQNFHTNTYWESPNAGEYISNKITSAGGSHNEFILVGFIPFGTKLIKNVDTYKRRNGFWKENYEVISGGIIQYKGIITPEEII